MVLLGLILILLPIGVGIILWTNVASKLWFKIVASVAMLICAGMIIGGGNTYNELEQAEGAIDYVAERDNALLDCLDEELKNNNFDAIIDYCIIPMVKDLRETYDRE